MEGLFLKLVNMSVSAGLIVLVILLARLFMRKTPKWINVAVWILVGLRLCLPISLQSELSLVPNIENGFVSLAEDNQENVISNNVTDTPSAPIIPDEPDIENDTHSAESVPAPVVPESVKPAVSEKTDYTQVTLNILIAVWIAGIIAMLAYMIVSYVKIYFRIREGAPDTDNVLLCDRINTPFVMGIINPKIYLPSNLDEQYKQYVIAHENAHLKRKDYLWKLIAFALLAIYWFNPLIWVAYIMLCRDIEFACDEKVIREYGDTYKAPYAEALLNCSSKRKIASINPLAFGEVSVKHRIKNILNYKKAPMWVMFATVILICFLLVGFMTDPVSDKKNDKKQDKVETVVSEDDDTKDITNDTTTEPTTPDENKPIENEPTESTPAESKTEDTSSEQKPVTSKPSTSKPQESEPKPLNKNLNPDSINYGYDYNLRYISNCELRIFEEYFGFSASEVKTAYLEMRGFETSETNSIYMKFMKLFDDGTLVFRAYRDVEAYDNTQTTYYIDDFEYSSDQRHEIRIYKNGKCYSLNTAYKKGIISQEIIKEIYENYIKDKNNNMFYMYPGFIGSLDFETAKIIKEEYVKIRGGTVNYIAFNHINTLKNGIIVMTIDRTDVSYPAIHDPIVMEMGEYVYAEQLPYVLKFYTNGKFYGLKEAYENGIITDDMLDEIFVKVK